MIIAVLIPTVFSSFGIEPAGRLLRKVFDGYSQMTFGILLFLSSTMAIRFICSHYMASVLFPITLWEITLLGLMALVTFLIVGVLGPQASILQEQAFEATTEQGKTLAYDKFFRFHTAVRALHLVNLGLAVGLFILKLKKGLTVSQNSQ